MREPTREHVAHDYLGTLRQGLAASWREPELRYTVLIGSVLLTAAFGPVVLVQPFLLQHEVPTALYGLYQAPLRMIAFGAAMVAFAYLIKEQAQETRWYKLTPMWLLGVALCFVPVAFRQRVQEAGGSYWVGYAAISALIAAGILLGRKRIAARLPANEVLDDVMYKSITVGFAFFTIATVLGALWAADAWGGYWSWDPKETWALIVWLNYAAWLHMRLVKGLRGTVAAWWALGGLAVTTFAFLGVNMFLSGLHSYGTL